MNDTLTSLIILSTSKINTELATDEMLANVFAFCALVAFYVVVILLSLGLSVFVNFVCRWKTYSKAGAPGWACFVPIYRDYVLYKISLGSGWAILPQILSPVAFIYGSYTQNEVWSIVWVILCGCSIILPILSAFGLAKNFDKGYGFALGLLSLPVVFIPILAFGKSKYLYFKN